MFFEAAQALERIFDRVNTLLKDDLLRCMLELLIDKSAPTARVDARLRCRSGCAAAERKQLLPLRRTVRPPLAGPHKIAYRFVRLVRRPHARQFAGSMQPRQRHRVARFVLIRSPARFGIRAGATTMQSWPRACTWHKARIPSAQLQRRHADARSDPPIS